MNTKPTPITADLQALADEIARDIGCAPAEALALAGQQRTGLRLFAAHWNAMSRRSRTAATSRGRRNCRAPAEDGPQEQA